MRRHFLEGWGADLLGYRHMGPGSSPLYTRIASLFLALSLLGLFFLSPSRGRAWGTMSLALGIHHGLFMNTFQEEWTVFVLLPRSPQLPFGVP